jgi:hypothetical protein
VVATVVATGWPRGDAVVATTVATGGLEPAHSSSRLCLLVRQESDPVGGALGCGSESRGWEWHPASDVGDAIGSGTLRPKALCCKGYGVNDVDDVFF